MIIVSKPNIEVAPEPLLRDKTYGTGVGEKF